MKKIISIMLCLVLAGMVFLGTAQNAEAAGSAHMSIRSSSGTLYRGDTFTLTVSLSNDQPVSNGGVILSYDSSAFEFLGGSCNVSNATLAEVSASRNGGVFVMQTDAVVSGTIFTINMRVKDSASFGSHSISGSASLSVPCSLSGTSVTVSCRHSYGSATQVDGSNHESACTICGQQKTEAHNWNSGTVVKAATCKDTGTRRLTCTGCAATKEETIPVTNDHKYGSWSKLSDTQHSHTCTVCGKQENANHTWNSGKVIKAATCKDTGTRQLTCTGCAHTKNETIPVTNNHKYGSWSKVSDTKHSRTCSVCAKKETVNHTWNSGTVTEKATCQQTGKRKLTCTGCSATKMETIPIADHDYGECVFVDDADHKRICSVCSHVLTEGHQYGDGWKHDENWHFRSCAGCGNETEQAAHTPGPKATETTDQVCTVCNRILKPKGAHVHSFAETWTTDEMGHWHACDDCNEKDSAAPHDFDGACDADCNTCGMIREPAHAPAEDWTSDSTGHWYACADCGEKVVFDPHTAGPAATISNPQVCTVCDFEMAPVLPHDHVFDDQGTIHSHACACGEVYTAEAGDCEICGSFPWWILCIVEALVFCGILGVGYFRLKKRGIRLL
ncbi:MAG: hypothetical protein IJZ39_13360 [Oscillospiraceae bacterium]|nr:hypothetical protein [Oscillospiraceae bacterium]